MKGSKLGWIIAGLFVLLGLGAYFWNIANMRKPPEDAVLFDSKVYKIFYGDNIPWKDAKRQCELMGGQLALCQDQATLDFLHKLKGGKRMWLGATDEAKEGDWRWLDGSEVTFEGWAPDQPHNLHGKEHYMELGWHGKFNDVKLEGAGNKYPIQGYICEWPAKEDTK